MRHLTILVPDGENNLSSIVGAYKIFSRANEYWKKAGKGELFKIELAGISNKVEFYGGLFSVNPNTHISAIKKTDLIIIPAIDGDMQTALEQNKDFIPWIVKQYKDGAQVASLCIGAFLLASTGLITGRNALHIGLQRMLSEKCFLM